MQECTFKPKINGQTSAATEVHVRGMERFLELKDLKRRQVMQLLEREAQVFK